MRNVAVILLVVCFLWANALCPKRHLPHRYKQGEYDFIVVGGGTAGAIIASRLSEKYHMLLVESGPALFKDDKLSAELASSILYGNELPLEVGPVEVDGVVVGTVDQHGIITNNEGAGIGFFRRKVPFLSPGRIEVHGRDVSGRAKVVKGEPNPLALPSGGEFGLHIQKTPFLGLYLSMTNASHYYPVVPQVYSQKREFVYPRGNLLGGSSATNGMVFFKGSRHDFDHDWKQVYGLSEWGYDDLVPFFKRFENATDIHDSDLHGYHGPVQTSIVSKHFEFAAAKEWTDAAVRLGWPRLVDANDPDNVYGASDEWQCFVDDEGRRSDSSDYIRALDKEGKVCWDKPSRNDCGPEQTLSVWTRKLATRLVIAPGTKRVIGVELLPSADHVYGARTDHPTLPLAADEGLKHRDGFTSWERTPYAARRGAPVDRSLAISFDRLDEQYVPPRAPARQYIRVTAKHEVILSAGVVGDAQLLMLSGIGPAWHLAEKGIAVVADLPVGQQVCDHPEVQLVYMFPASYRVPFDLKADAAAGFPSVKNYIAGHRSIFSSNLIPAGLDGSSRGPDSIDKQPTWHLHHILIGPIENLDFNVAMSTEAAEPPTRIPRSTAELMEWRGLHYHTHLCELSKSHTHGTIMLRNDDPLVPPLVDPRYAASDEDVRELVDCLKTVRKIMAEADPTYVGEEIGPCRHARTDEQLAQCVRNQVWGHHLGGSAPMMECDRQGAVCDQHARVYGVDGLRVVDISLFPTLPHGNPSGVVMMVAERLAEVMLEEYEMREMKGEL